MKKKGTVSASWSSCTRIDCEVNLAAASCVSGSELVKRGGRDLLRMGQPGDERSKIKRKKTCFISVAGVLGYILVR